ncbi:UDP N acetylglucosamine transporter [Echinococcus multilocularis]|uniref:UDP N acetylglucosamine transporter n=1 Tax=Echinococcus multilocularis TaxID=6211 RepID=A0A068Y039_ECHMU|nr:UDP N acetylglucosamine transporter [Echinococcus multilocularis]
MQASYSVRFSSQKSKSRSMPSLALHPRNLKAIGLVILTLQTTALVLLMRYTRLPSPTNPASSLYLTSTAVFCAEVCKVVACFWAVFVQNGNSLRATSTELQRELFSAPLELVKLGIPAGLYTLQNNLLYVALSNLDAATYQITYQLKILTTAVFMVVMLRKRITISQWIALLILIIGVAFVQLAPSANATAKTPKPLPAHQNTLIGLTAVILASLSSGFAGVYFEKLMKFTSPSIWIRNIQLGFWGSILAFIGVFLTDGHVVMRDGFFRGYNLFVVIVVALQSLGGLCVAVVIKYADNILKVFATSISIIFSCLASYYLLNDFQPNWYFAIGTIAVLSATALYNLGGREKPPPSELPLTASKD